jgi:hypothetical protein
MSAGNRRNPDHTSALGQFGWDVLAGFYRVGAQHSGCTATTHKTVALTPIYPVPPPVNNLALKLNCPDLRRVVSRTTLLAARIDQGTAIALTATVRGSAHRPTGLATFFAAGRALRTLPISPLTGRTVWVVPSKVAESFTVRYQGDGYNTPSSARARIEDEPTHRASSIRA